MFPLFHQFSLQPDINMKIQALLNDYLDSHFRPAWRNMKTNLGKTGLVVIIFFYFSENTLFVLFF